MISLDGILNNHLDIKIKNFITLQKNNQRYFKELNGDDVDNAFNSQLMDIYLDAFTTYTVDQIPLLFDDIIEINVLKCDYTDIRNLPQNLQKLNIKSSICRSIVLPLTVQNSITHLDFDFTNLNSFPNISGCSKLQSCRIIHSALERFDISYLLPASLVELNLSGNMIRNNTENYFSYTALESKLLKRISFSDNCLDSSKFSSELNFKCNLKRQNIHKINSFQIQRNLNRANIQHFVDRAQDAKPANALVNNNQTVHLSSVNKSVVNSVKVINDYIAKYELNIDITLTPAPYIFGKNGFHYWLKKYGLSCMDICNLKTEHSIVKLSYEDIFKRIWVITHHLTQNANDSLFKRKDILERLSVEIKESIGYCFTGRFNRLVNSLSGILDGVYVGISNSEEIQFEMGRVLEKLNNPILLNYDFKTAYCDAYEILQQSSDKFSWMEALMDLAPDPELTIINSKNYLLDWDNIVTLPPNHDPNDYSNCSQIGVYADDFSIMWIHE
jgi:hypothetical protein